MSYTIGFNQLGVDLDKVTSGGLTVCPKCSHDRKHSNRNKKVLWLSQKTGAYKCHHCGIEGRVDSNEWIENKHAKETGLIPTRNKSVNTQETRKAVNNMKPFRTGPLSNKAIAYLSDRGISKETAEACKVAEYQSCLCFNYYKESEIVGAKYRKLDEKFFWQHAGTTKYLYGLNDIKEQDTIIIVEGEFDKLAFYEAGIKNVASIAQGAPNAGSDVGTKLQCLDNSIDYIKNAKRVILACDNDENGQYLTKVLIERFGADRCATVEMPEGCKDANDVLIHLGKEKLIELIDNAKDTPIAGVRTLSQAKEKMYNIYRNGYRKGTKTGVRGLNKHFSFYKMWWYLWHGIPNSGKSAFVNFMMMCMSANHGWKWAVFSPEHYPEEDFYLDMVELLTGRSTDIRNPNRLNEQEFEVAMKFVEKHFFFVYPQVDNISNSCENVLSKIKELKLSKGIDGFLIDPYNQLTRGAENIDVYLERSLNDVDNLCNTHNLVGNIVAHPRTLYKEKGEEDYKKSTPYQVAGGAMWYNKAYVITNVHRPYNQSNKIDTSVEIDVQKVKSHKRAGTPGCIDMKFDRHTGWYISLTGSCALDGAFEELLKQAGVQQASEQTELTFTEKMEAEQNKPNINEWGHDLNQCPF